MLYIQDTDFTQNDEFIKKCYERMSKQRQEYVQKYVSYKDRINGIIGYDLLKRGLAQEYGIASNPYFLFSRYGKPYLKEYPNICFNISHCGVAVACAISNYDVGVDIETIRQIDKSIIEYCCKEEEKEKIYDSINPNIEFAKIWTMKESYIKMLGIGIQDDIKSVLEKATDEILFSIMVNEHKGYVCSLCCNRNAVIL
jgi:4'-phosphopantetheinyl transferase